MNDPIDDRIALIDLDGTLCDYDEGEPKAHPNVLRYDGTDVIELREAIRAAYERPAGSHFRGAST